MPNTNPLPLAFKVMYPNRYNPFIIMQNLPHVACSCGRQEAGILVCGIVTTGHDTGGISAFWS